MWFEALCDTKEEAEYRHAIAKTRFEFATQQAQQQ